VTKSKLTWMCYTPRALQFLDYFWDEKTKVTYCCLCLTET